MSNYIKVNTEFFNTNLGPLEILMLSVFESYARDNKQCYLTNDQLAKMFNVSEKTIRNALDTLEAKNYIKRNTEFTPKLGKANRKRTIELVHLKPEKKFEFSF
jgi:DNA-binding MarR family transcriptional regulator